MFVVTGCSRRHHVGEVVDLTVQKGFKPTYGRYVHAFHQGLTEFSDAIIVSVSASRHNIYAPARDFIYAPADVVRRGGGVLKLGGFLRLVLSTVSSSKLR